MVAHGGEQEVPAQAARDNGEVAHDKRRRNAPPLGGAHVAFQRFGIFHTLHGQPKQAEANAKKHQRGQALAQRHVKRLVSVSGKRTVGLNALASSTVIMPYAITMTTSPG